MKINSTGECEELCLLLVTNETNKYKYLLSCDDLNEQIRTFLFT